MNVSDPITPKVIAEFDELCELEPRLRELFEEAKAVIDDKSEPAFCANAYWYGYGSRSDKGLKPRLERLVGRGAGRPDEIPNTLGIPNDTTLVVLRADELVRKMQENLPPDPNTPAKLRTSRAYDVAYCVIYDCLPNCRNCAC